MQNTNPQWVVAAVGKKIGKILGNNNDYTTDYFAKVDICSIG